MKLYCLILDRSGSMYSIWDEITEAVTGHLKVKSGGALCSLLLFDSEGMDFLFKYAARPRKLNTDNFRPRGGTPLRDAIMLGIETLAKDWGDFLFQDFVEVEFTVFTDGKENQSQWWTSEDVDRAVSHFQENHGWKFSFIGAGGQSDVANYARQFGIKEENVVGYKDKSELKEAFAQA